MRKAIICLALCAVSGCAETKKIAEQTDAMTAVYESKMAAGQTTPAQDQQFIHAVSKDVYQLDRAVRGTSAADATRAAVNLVNSVPSGGSGAPVKH